MSTKNISIINIVIKLKFNLKILKISFIIGSFQLDYECLNWLEAIFVFNTKRSILIKLIWSSNCYVNYYFIKNNFIKSVISDFEDKNSYSYKKV